MPPDKQPASARRTLKPACDACHMRRVKCSHEQPCFHCLRLGITCEYKKASTAKKTAGKRIEALRLADKNKQEPATPPIHDQRSERSWSHSSPSSTTPVLNSVAWPPGSASSAAGMPGPYHPNSSSPFPRHSMSASDDRRYHQDDGRPPQGYGGASTSYASPNAPAPRPSNGAWPGQVPPSPRTRMAYENARQVRFQSAGPSPRVSAQYDSSFGSEHQPYPGGYPHQAQRQASGDYGMVAPAQHGGGIGGASTSSLGPQQQQGLLFGAPSSAGQYNGPSSFPSQSSTGSSSLGAGELGAPGGPYQSIPPSVSFAIGGSDMSGMDFLESSVLPPFSTSMVDSLMDDSGTFNAESLFSETTMPPLATTNGQQTVLDMLGTCLPTSTTPGSSTSGSAFDGPRGMTASDNGMSSGDRAAFGASSTSADTNVDDIGLGDESNHPLSDSVLIPTLALFYERLGGVMPVFSRTWLFSRLDRDDHMKDPHFAAMLMAMSALTIMQAQPNTEGRERKANRMSGRRRRARAVKLLEEALKIRESPFMGQSVTLEQCCTSFFVFATLFGLGEHLAGWYRLRESITIAHLCRLHEPASYENLPKDEAERRLRMYWLLAITERAFAIQSRMPIVLTGNPRASTASLRARLGVRELSDFPDLQLKLFDVVDEKFVDCWNQKCQGAGCRNFDRERAIALWRAFTDGINQSSSSSTAAGKERSPGNDERDEDLPGSASSASSHQHRSSFSSSRPSIAPTPVQRNQVQKADVEVTRHWLLNRLWLITLNHGLLSLDAKEPPLRIDHAIHVAQSALDVCNDHLSLPSMEAHGVGFTYKLFDIAQTLVLLCNDEAIADAISRRGHLEKQTTAAHTSGRPHFENRRSNSVDTSLHNGSAGAPNSSTPYSMSEGGGAPTLPPLYMTEMAHMGSMRGPASLRQNVLNILNDYLTLFQKFRGGDHPYLEKLMDLIEELKKKGSTGSDYSQSAPSSQSMGAPAMRSMSQHSIGDVNGSGSSRTSDARGADVNASTVSSFSSSSRQIGASPRGYHSQMQSPPVPPLSGGMPNSYGSGSYSGGNYSSNGGVPVRNRHSNSISSLMSGGAGGPNSNSPRSRLEGSAG